MEGDDNQLIGGKIVKVGLFAQFLIKLGIRNPPPLVVEEEEEEEKPDPPQFIIGNDFANCTAVYGKKFTLKEIKRIYKRIINPTEPQFVDVIKCNKVEMISKMRINFIFKFILQIQAFITMTCHSIIKHPIFEAISLVVIIVNSFVLAVDDGDVTVPQEELSGMELAIYYCNEAFLWIYTVEMILKILGLGFVKNEGSYLRDVWNCLDFVIVVSALYAYYVQWNKERQGIYQEEGSSLTALRSLRILRPLKSIAKSQDLKVILNAIIASVPMLLNILFIVAFFILVCSIAGTQLFSGQLVYRCLDIENGILTTEFCNANAYCTEKFGSDMIQCAAGLSNPNQDITSFDNIFSSALMVWQIITMEGWTYVMYSVQKTSNAVSNVYFIIVVLAGSFFLINLILAVITIYFSMEQRNSRLKAEELKQKSMEELQRSFNFSSFAEIGYKRILMKKDIGFLKRFNRSYKNLKRSLYNQGFFEYETNNKINNIPKNSIIITIKSAISIFYQKPEKRKQTLKRFNTSYAIQKFDESTKFDRNHPNFLKVQTLKAGPVLCEESSEYQSDGSVESKEDSFIEADKKETDKLLEEMNRIENAIRNEQSPHQGLQRKGSITFNKQGTSSSLYSQFLQPRSKKTMSLLSIATIGKSKIKFMGMQGKRSFAKKLPKIKEGPEIHKELSSLSDDDGISSQEEDLLKSNKFKRDRKQAKKGGNIDFIFNEGESVKQQIEKDPQSQGSFFLSESELDDAISVSHSSRNKTPTQMKREMRDEMIRNKQTKTRRLEDQQQKKFEEGQLMKDIMGDIDNDQIPRATDSDLVTVSNFSTQRRDSQRKFFVKTKENLEQKQKDIRRGSKDRVKKQKDSYDQDSLLASDNTPRVQQGGKGGRLEELGIGGGEPGGLYSQQKPESNEWIVPHSLPKVLLISKEENIQSEEVEYVKKINNYEFFKIRIKHFEEYDGNSKFDVLVNRQREVRQKEIQQEAKKFFETRLPIHYWKRSDPVSLMDEEQLKEKKELDALETCRTMSRSHDVNSYGSVLDEISIKSIEEEYKIMPEIPLVQHEAAFHIQDFIEKRDAKWDRAGENKTRDRNAESRRQEIQKHARRVKKERDELRWLKIFQSPETEYKYVKDCLRNEYLNKKSFYQKDLAYNNTNFNNEIELAEEYLELRRMDQGEGRIKDYNFSGDQVKERLQHKYNICNKIFKSLTLHDGDDLIWIKGYYGITLAFKRKVNQFVFSGFFDTFIIIMVILNTITLGLENIGNNNLIRFRMQANQVFSWIFIVELVLKVYALGPKAYIQDKMNLFDAIIVATSIMEMLFVEEQLPPAVDADGNEIIEEVVEEEEAPIEYDEEGNPILMSEEDNAFMKLIQNAKIFRILKTLKVFRVFRTIKLLRALDYLQVIIDVVQRTYEQFLYIIFLLLICILIFSLLGLQLYKNKLDTINPIYLGGVRQNFNKFGYAFLTVFQIMTMENWQEILYVTMQTDVNNIVTITYLIVWIFIGNFVLLNLFLAILIEGFTSKEKRDEDDIYFGEEDKECELIRTQKKRELRQKRKQAEELALIRQNSEAIYQSQNSGLTRQSSKSSDQSDQTDLHSKKDVSVSGEDIKKPQAYQMQTQNSIESNRKMKKKEITFITKGYRCERSLFLFSYDNCIRKICFAICTKYEHTFDTFILIVIFIGSLKLAIITFIDDELALVEGTHKTVKDILDKLDYVFNFIYFFEFLIKAITMGFILDKNSYLTVGWNRLDFIIVLSFVNEYILGGGRTEILQILRMLRILRPLRFISHKKSLRIIVNSLIGSLTGIMNVTIVILLVFVMFSILGVYLFKERLKFCDIFGMSDFETLSINKQQCEEDYEGFWRARYFNFDHILNGMVTLFILASLEAWPQIMQWIQDGSELVEENGPLFEASWGQAVIFCLLFIVLGSFFFMNLFVGVIFDEFEHQREIENSSNAEMSQAQRDWIDMHSLIIKATPNFNLAKPPNTKWRLYLYNIIKHWLFEIVIMMFIMLNIVAMGMQFNQEPQWYSNMLTYVNLFFTFVFIIECGMKLLAFGPYVYFFDGWRQFDFFVVCASLIDIVLIIIKVETISFLQFGPQLARVLRILRVTRLIRLVKSLKNLQKIMQTMIYSFPSLLNVIGLLLLFYFILSCLAQILFQKVTRGTQINTDIVNFDNFASSFMTLFRCSTGEDWQAILADLWWQPEDGCVEGIDCGVVLVQQFEQNETNPDNPLDMFHNYTDEFRQLWTTFSSDYEGWKMQANDLPRFFARLPQPMGFSGMKKGELNYDTRDDPDEKISMLDVSKQIFAMEIAEDNEGFAYFNDVLFCALKNTFGYKLIGQKEGPPGVELYTVNQKSIPKLQRDERETRDELAYVRGIVKQKYEYKKGITRKQRHKLKKDIQNKRKIAKQSNPFLIIVVVKMAYKAWLQYTKNLKNKQKLYLENGQEFFEDLRSSDDNSQQEYSDDDDKSQDSKRRKMKKLQKQATKDFAKRERKNTDGDYAEIDIISNSRKSQDDYFSDDEKNPIISIPIPEVSSSRKSNGVNNSTKQKRKRNSENGSMNSNVNVNINNNYIIHNNFTINQDSNQSNSSQRRKKKKNVDNTDESSDGKIFNPF